MYPRHRQEIIMKKRIILIGCILLIFLAGCGAESENKSEVQTEAAPAVEIMQVVPEEETVPEEPAGSEEASETVTESEPARKDGERFEDVIMLEGMEEPVKYEHARNDVIGVELDYEYETLARNSESDKERFISIYDDADNPENYLEVTYRPENIDTVTASISEELSKEYEIQTDQYELDKAGGCTRIYASAGADGAVMPELLQTVYIIPSGDGTVVAAAHYTIESAEGFGHRFDYMVNTLACF